MPDSRTIKKIFNWTPQTARSKERPKQRWEDNTGWGIKISHILKRHKK
jgi:hypothetical protein